MSRNTCLSEAACLVSFAGPCCASLQKEVSERAARVGEIQKQLQEARENKQSLLQHALIRDRQIMKLERASDTVR